MSYPRGEADVIAGVKVFQDTGAPARTDLGGGSQFADGLSYSKNKMDEILKSGALDKLPPRHKEHHPHVKREDVELIVSRELGRGYVHTFPPWNEGLISNQQIQVHELEIPKSHAEKALHEAGGDVSKALKALVRPKKGFGVSKSPQS